MNNINAPLCLFVFNRAEETKNTLINLSRCVGANDLNLYIFCDGPRSDDDLNCINEVRRAINDVKGFSEVKIFFSEKNKGLARSIIDGVTEVFKIHDRVIVLEDDLLVSKNFLVFMNKALSTYSIDSRIFSVSGFSPDIGLKSSDEFDIYLWERAHAWGWATWKDRWDSINWDLEFVRELIPSLDLEKMDYEMGPDFISMIKKLLNGKINSWYVRFGLNQFVQKKLTIYPAKSKVFNMGFSPSSTHCNVYNRYKVDLDEGENVDFDMPADICLNRGISKKARFYYSNYSRAFGKLMTGLMKVGLVNQRKK